MLFSDFLIGALFLIVSFTTATYGNSFDDEAPIPDEQHLGKDNCCCFEYKKEVKIDEMKKKLPTAEKIDVGHLPHYRLDFAEFSSGQLTLTTVVPDEAEEVYGMAYKLPIADYLAYMEALPSQRNRHSVIATVEVTINGEIQKLQCNTLVLKDQPPKETPLPDKRRPWKSLQDKLLQAYKDAGLPPAYITKVSEIPTRG